MSECVFCTRDTAKRPLGPTLADAASGLAVVYEPTDWACEPCIGELKAHIEERDD